MIQRLPTEVVQLLIPLHLPGGPLRSVVVRPICDRVTAECRAGRRSMLEEVANAAGLARNLGMALSNVDLDRIAEAVDRCRMTFVAEREAAAA